LYDFVGLPKPITDLHGIDGPGLWLCRFGT